MIKHGLRLREAQLTPPTNFKFGLRFRQRLLSIDFLTLSAQAQESVAPGIATLPPQLAAATQTSSSADIARPTRPGSAMISHSQATNTRQPCALNELRTTWSR